MMDPFEEMKRMQNDMNRMFSRFDEQTPFRQPAVDLMDQGNEIVVLVDLPGMKKEDIDLECTEEYLKIQAKSGEDIEKKKKGYYYSERSMNSFSRTLHLPEKVLPNKSKSTFKNGVLEVHLPKKENKKEKKNHKIKVE